MEDVSKDLNKGYSSLFVVITIGIEMQGFTEIFKSEYMESKDRHVKR